MTAGTYDCLLYDINEPDVEFFSVSSEMQRRGSSELRGKYSDIITNDVIYLNVVAIPCN